MKNKLIFGIATTVAVAAGLAIVRWYSSKDKVNQIDPKDYFDEDCCEESECCAG